MEMHVIIEMDSGKGQRGEGVAGVVERSCQRVGRR